MEQVQPIKTPYFHFRPLCAAAVGALLGVLSLSLLPPPGAYLMALLPLLGAVYAGLSNRRGWYLLLLFVALGLVYGGLRYPPEGTVLQGGPVVELPPGSVRDGLAAIRESLTGRITELFSENPGVATGMLLGDKAGVGEDVMGAFEDAGILHLMAVSGLHVSVLAGAFSLLFRGNPWVRFAATALFCGLYAAVTNFSPSVLRASVMLLTALLAAPLLRRADGPSTLAFAFLAVLAVNPFALFRTGFQLSFSAVYGLLLLREPLGRPIRRLGSVAEGLLAGSLAVVIATGPAMALAFRKWSFLSLVTNVIVLPLAPVFLVPALLAVGVSYLWPQLAVAIAAPARLALNAIVEVALLSGRWETAASRPGWAAYLLFLAALPFFSRYCLLEKGKARLLGAGLLAGSMGLWLMGL